MRSRKLNKTRMILILILCAVTLGFALLFSDLNINGIGHILAPKWKILWDKDSIVVNNKSVEGPAPVVNEEKDTVTFEANLHIPGDFYEFTIDAVNEGTIDGMITSVDTIFYDENDEEIELPYYLEYDVVNADDDKQLSEYQTLLANQSKKYKVRLEYSRRINNEDLPDEQINLTGKIIITYEKKDDRAITVEPYVRNLCNNTLNYNETTTFKANKVEDLVCLSQKTNSGTNFKGKIINLEKDINFLDRSSYVKSRDTSYGDINEDGEVKEIFTEITTGKGFKPIGNGSSYFRGTFIGNMNNLSNLTITRPDEDYVGLFGYVYEGAIKELKIENIKVEGKNNVGGISGYNYYVTIQTLETEKIEVKGVNTVGGIIGNSTQGIIREVKFDTKVTGKSSVGGIAGSGTVVNSVGKVEVTGGDGITSSTFASSNGVIIESGHASGNRFQPGFTSWGSTTYYFSNCYYLEGYTAGNNQGTMYDSGASKNINAYENAIDTWIGGDNDGTGYYFAFDENNEIHLVSVEDHPITFTLQGTGTEQNPYLIHNTTEWNEATTKAQQVGVYFKLANDIDFTNKEFYKMGSPLTVFNGTLDGDNHKISGVTIHGGSYEGIFGYIGSNGSVKNITIENMNILKGSTYIGGLTGYIYSGGTLEKIRIKDTALEGANTSSYIGGITGYQDGANASVFLDENSNIEIDGITITGNAEYVGGVAGYVKGKIQKQIDNFKEINVKGKRYVGGIIGYLNSGGLLETIEQNNLIVVEVNNSYVGGFVGDNNGTVREIKFNTKVTNTISTDAWMNTGGVVGDGDVTNAIGRSVVYSSERGASNTYYYEVGGITGYGSVNGAILLSGSCNRNLFIGGRGTTTNAYYFSDYTYESASGILLDNSSKNVTAYESAIDTIIGGDNDGTGYYFAFDENNEIHLVSVEDEPIPFTLQGTGTEQDPYLIHNTTEWNEATTKAQQVGVYFKLANDIDFTNKEFYKMGSPLTVFNGTLDGDNHKISGVTIHGGSYEGIFGYIGSNGSVKNITIENMNILKGSTYIGGLTGYIYSGGTLEKIRIKDTALEGANTSSYIGGITGYQDGANASVFLDENSNIEIDGITITGNAEYVGGVAGYVKGKIQKQIDNFKEINVKGKRYVGGIIGYLNSGGLLETIEQNNLIVVEVNNSYVGGFVGDNNGTVREIKFNTKVTNTISTDAWMNTGGVVGDGDVTNAIGRSVVYSSERGASNTYYYEVGGITGYGSVNGAILLSGSCNRNLFIGGSGTTTNAYYFSDYTFEKASGTLWSNNYLNDLEKYSLAIETPLTGDTDGSGYVFDYILADGEIHLVPLSNYTGWKLMNNLTPMTSQKWAYYDDTTHERIMSGWNRLYDMYNTLQWYYFEDGYAKSGWLEENGNKYYLSTFDDDGNGNSNGYMNCNRIENTSIMIDEVLYTFDSNGVCTNCN